MTAEDVYAVILERGIVPAVGPAGLTLTGDVSPALARVVERHRLGLTRLAALGWQPPLAGGGEARGEVAAAGGGAFDADAERLVRDLYAMDYGIRWKAGAVSFFPNAVTPRFEAWLSRARPLRDRLISHVRPRDDGFHWLVFLNERYPKGDWLRETRSMFCLVEKGKDSRWHYTPAGHPFDLEFPSQYAAWRYDGESHWRTPWGWWLGPRHVVDNAATGRGTWRYEWRAYGDRRP